MFSFRFYLKSNSDRVDPISPCILYLPHCSTPQMEMAHDIKADSFMPKTTQCAASALCFPRSVSVEIHNVPLQMTWLSTRCNSLLLLLSFALSLWVGHENSVWIIHTWKSFSWATDPRSSARQAENETSPSVLSPPPPQQRRIAVKGLNANEESSNMNATLQVLQEVRLKTSSAWHWQCKDENLWLATLAFH